MVKAADVDAVRAGLADGTQRPNSSANSSAADVGAGRDGDAVRGAEVLERLIREGVMPAGSGYPEMEAGMASGKVGMMINGPWSWVNLKRGGIDFGVGADRKLEVILRALLLGVTVLHADADDGPRTALPHVLRLLQRANDVEAEKLGEKFARRLEVRAFDCAVREQFVVDDGGYGSHLRVSLQSRT